MSERISRFPTPPQLKNQGMDHERAVHITTDKNEAGTKIHRGEGERGQYRTTEQRTTTGNAIDEPKSVYLLGWCGGEGIKWGCKPGILGL